MKVGNKQQAVRNSEKYNQFVFVVCALLLALSFPAEAQQAKKVYRIGYLGGTSYSSDPARHEAFRQGLRALGWVEGKNIAIEYRFAEGKFDRLPELIRELVNLKVDVIVSGGPAGTRVLKEANIMIPIVMGIDNDPVGSGFVASLARPGGNITGLTSAPPEISGKHLELLKEIVPKLSRVAVLGNSLEPANAQALRQIELAAGAFRVQLQYLDVRSSTDIETAFRAASKGRADAVLLLVNSVITSHGPQFAALAVKSRLPTIYPFPEFVEAGGLVSYGASISHLFRRAATYVDKILKGAKPADLPVERPTKFELVINLKAAKQIGLTIPPNVLARADKVIK